MTTLIELVTDFNQYVSKIPNGCEYIANALRSSNPKEGFKGIQDFSEGVLWLADATELLNHNEIPYDFDLSKAEYFLQLINTKLEREDYLAVADIFEEDIASFFVHLPKIGGFDN